MLQNSIKACAFLLIIMVSTGCQSPPSWIRAIGFPLMYGNSLSAQQDRERDCQRDKQYCTKEYLMIDDQSQKVGKFERFMQGDFLPCMTKSLDDVGCMELKEEKEQREKKEQHVVPTDVIKKWE